ncbi:phenylacetate--CoA ligase family protein [Bacillus sp. SJS]|uniref:phenylacetate--CoA ligase family protein n=1 Tax=Bacillus sp. SJS TaxID=1423321 RepID=UPI0004DCB59C|nr:AMP-binding protein [Bacillus sp. SJS]KZZ85583.1 phenylacetate--CoA ligase [Bacillus sp. SJS]
MIFHREETLARHALEDQQLEDLKKTVRTVYEKSPFYKEWLRKAGITPDQIQQLKDIQKLPFTQKKHYPFGLFAADRKDLIRIHASSGTSGKPTIVGYTKQDIESWADLAARAIAIGGGTPDGILHNAYGYGLFTGGLGLHAGGERLGMAVVPVSVGNTDRQITLIEDLQPEVICCTPSYALNIAERMRELGKDPRSSSLQYGIFGAEPWSEEMRRTLEDRLGIKACDIYGLSEVMGPGVAMECHEAQDGLHIAEDHFLAEVIDPDTFEPVPDGQPGELVFTSLKKEAIPIIRYRTGDIASITRKPCKCGRTTARMSRIKGRIDDMLIIRGINVFPSEIEHYLITVPEISPHYQLHLHKQGPLDEVTLHVEINDGLYAEVKMDLTHEKIGELQRHIQQLMRSSCLVSIDVRILAPKSIPRSEGKAVRIIDARFPQAFA